jgi:hypothetical protein
MMRMLNIGTGTMLVLMLSMCVACQMDSGPRVVFDATMRDFGKVVEGQPLKHRYTFTNRGSAPLNIEDVRST